ncbi:ATP-binding protein [Minwuia sp.]|uniref:ATP-binding protein n=1 Tax=Minwuia sp. TaxID=2493630 RepID=UPI003A8D860E
MVTDDASIFWSLSKAFLQNLTLLIVLAYALSLIWARLGQADSIVRQSVLGLIFSVASVACMNMPLEPQPGLLLDQRGLILLFAAPFGGPWAALIAGGVTALYRIHLGGVGMWAGLGAIALTVPLGMLIARYGGGLKTVRSAALGGLLLAAVTIPWFLAVSGIGPGLQMIQSYGPVYLIFYLVGAIVLSSILMVDHRRRESERRLFESETKLRDVLDVSTDWFWEVDADLRFTFFSESCRRVFSRDPSAYLGKRRSEIALPEQRAAVLEYEAMLQRREPFADFTYAMLRADGRIRYVSVCGKPVYDADGNFAGYRGSGREVTDVVLAKQELEAALNDAEAANKAKSRFLSQMSHELRTPLNAVIGFADLIRNEVRGPVGNPGYRQDATDIYESGHHLLGLINDILDLAKVEAGMLVLDRQDHDVTRIVDSSVRMMRQRAQEAGISVTVASHVDDATGRVDQRAAKQIVLNLLTNAIKFTERGGVIAIAVEEAAAGMLQIKISDTGCGIAPDEMEKVFRPFEQAENTRTRAIEGTGLGLPICNALAEAHGGTLRLESRLGQGTTVRVTLPRARARLDVSEARVA